MKFIFKTILLATFLLLNSCNKTTYKNESSSFLKIEEDLKNKFGAGAFYTDIIIELDHENVKEISVTQTKNPYLLKMQGWKLQKNTWKQYAQVDLELAKGEIEDYMFQLNDDVTLSKINELQQKISVKEDFFLNTIKILAPENGDTSKLVYKLIIQKNSSNKLLEFNFDKNGYPLFNENSVSLHELY